MPTAFAVSVSNRDPGTQVRIPCKLSIPYGIWWILNPSKFSRLTELTQVAFYVTEKSIFYLFVKSHFHFSINYILYDITWTSQPLSHILSWERQVDRKCPQGTSFRRLKCKQVQFGLQILLRLFGNQLLLWTYHKCFHHPFTTPTSLNISLTFNLASA